MVTKASAGPPIDTSIHSSAILPYPTSPAQPLTASSVYSDDLHKTPAFDLIDMTEAQEQRERRGSNGSVATNGTWDSEDSTEQHNGDDNEEDFVAVPQPLKIKSSSQNINLDSGDAEGKKEDGLPAALQPGGGQSRQADLPASLRPGPPSAIIQNGNGHARREQSQSESGHMESNNPYLHQKINPSSLESSQAAWQQPTTPPPPPPVWQQPTTPPPPPPVWQQPTTPPPPVPVRKPLPTTSQETTAWRQESATRPPPPTQAPPPPPISGAPPAYEFNSTRTPSQELSRMSLQDGATAEPMGSYSTSENLSVPQRAKSPLAPIDERNSSDSHAFPPSNPWAGNDPLRTPSPNRPPKEALSPVTTPPQLPARNAGHSNDLAQPLLPSISTARPPPAHLIPTPSESPGTRDRRQRGEYYQIKHVNWYDASSTQGVMRRSPILTQTANGPCPLLALVNALVLTTPPDADTELVKTLSTREQVSLGLLLDAVFEELMSGRRGESAHELPDVGDLYAFLLALHTGMNVNPRFVTPAITPRGSLDGHPSATNGLHPSSRSQFKAGSFEETREMRLYSTFNIPLIHGWLPSADTPVLAAFQRSATSFEDAQNIQFEEAELESKVRGEGLSFEEQQKLEDILTIKSFLETWPTQLTDHGLEAIAGSLKPGQVAILFRNDHFSTIYKEPKRGTLMTLVTDAGYSSHEEIVWESLVDVSGAACEMYSGDFRNVSHGAEASAPRQSTENNDGFNLWQAAQDRYQTGIDSSRPSIDAAAPRDETPPPPLPGPRPTVPSVPEETQPGQLSPSEQEDHDLALALQLQEEEEDQARQRNSRRQREQELSEQFLSSEEATPPEVPPRRTFGRRSTTQSSFRPSGRSGVNRPAIDEDPDAPPTYEQSRTDRMYHPPGSAAATAQGNPLNTLDALQNSSAYAQQNATNRGSPPLTHSRRASGNRLSRRRSSMQPSPSTPPAGFGSMPAQGGGSAAAGSYYAPPYSATAAAGGPSSGGVVGAANVRDTEDKCVVM